MLRKELLWLQVSVQRRETDRQKDARLKSYSHHAKQEQEEPWVKLQLHGAGPSCRVLQYTSDTM